MKIDLYINSLKGYVTFLSVIEKHGKDILNNVYSEQDFYIERDYYKEIANLCINNGITVNKKNDIKPDVSFAIGWKKILDTNNLIVLHDSILPEYRGFAPIIAALQNGDKILGVTAFYAEKEPDTGNIIEQETIKIEYPIKIEKALELTSCLYGKIVTTILDKLLNKEKLKQTPQTEYYATYSPWLDEKDYEIDWKESSEVINRFIDSVGYPYTGAKTCIGNDTIIVYDSEVYGDLNIVNRKRHIGKVLKLENGYPIVICGNGLLKLTNISKKIKLKTRFNGRS